MDENEIREVFHCLNEFLQLDSQGGSEVERVRKKVYFIQDHPKVLGGTADTVMDHLIEEATDEPTKAYLKEQRKFLQKQTKFSLLEIYMQESDPSQKKKMLFMYPELFGEEICGMLERLIELQEDPNAVAAWTMELQRLLKIREKSLEFPTLSFKRH